MKAASWRNGCYGRWLAVCLVMAWALVGVSWAEAPDDARIEKALKSFKRAGITAEKWIDAGEIDAANRLLGRAVVQFPNNDYLLVLRGQALFAVKKIDESEEVLRQALNINPQNQKAGDYIEKIRSIREKQTSTGAQEWMAIAKDKIGDFVVLVIGIWLGTTLNTIASKFNQWRSYRRSCRAFRNEDYEGMTDLLEKELDPYDPASIRKNLLFMLHNHKDQENRAESVRKILIDFVDNKEHLDILLSMLKRCADGLSARQHEQTLL